MARTEIPSAETSERGKRKVEDENLKRNKKLWRQGEKMWKHINKLTCKGKKKRNWNCIKKEKRWRRKKEETTSTIVGEEYTEEKNL